MLSALIRSERSYPAVGEASQLAHQRLSHLGPLVLKMTRLAVKLPSAFALLRVVSIHPEGTFGRLRYPLGGDRPSQTTRLALSARWLTARHERQNCARVVFHRCLPHPHKGRFSGSHLCYASAPSSQG